MKAVTSNEVVREYSFRACCGKLRWSLLDIVEDLGGRGARLNALRWGTGEVPLDLEIDASTPAEVVDSILTATELHYGTSPSCFTGGGTLLVELREGEPHRRE